MNKDWLEWLENFENHAFTDAGHALHDFALHVHWSHWHPISTAPYNQDVELRIADATAILTLEFPCRQTNSGDWINADLGTRIMIQPVEWRVWQHGKSPQPHRSPVNISDRSSFPHYDNWSAKRPPRKKGNS